MGLAKEWWTQMHLPPVEGGVLYQRVIWEWCGLFSVKRLVLVPAPFYVEVHVAMGVAL